MDPYGQLGVHARQLGEDRLLLLAVEEVIDILLQLADGPLQQGTVRFQHLAGLLPVLALGDAALPLGLAAAQVEQFLLGLCQPLLQVISLQTQLAGILLGASSQQLLHLPVQVTVALAQRVELIEKTLWIATDLLAQLAEVVKRLLELIPLFVGLVEPGLKPLRLPLRIFQLTLEFLSDLIGERTTPNTQQFLVHRQFPVTGHQRQLMHVELQLTLVQHRLLRLHTRLERLDIFTRTVQQDGAVLGDLGGQAVAALLQFLDLLAQRLQRRLPLQHELPAQLGRLTCQRLLLPHHRQPLLVQCLALASQRKASRFKLRPILSLLRLLDVECRPISSQTGRLLGQETLQRLPLGLQRTPRTDAAVVCILEASSPGSELLDPGSELLMLRHRQGRHPGADPRLVPCRVRRCIRQQRRGLLPRCKQLVQQAAGARC